RVLFLRRWLSREHGEAPSPVQAACWLDVKRAYMELRPDLRRVYLAVRDLPTYAPTALKLRFQPLPDAPVALADPTYHTAMLDFGPSSVAGWLCALVQAELGTDDPDVLDVEARELLVDGRRVPLTRLEFELRHDVLDVETVATHALRRVTVLTSSSRSLLDLTT